MNKNTFDYLAMLPIRVKERFFYNLRALNPRPVVFLSCPPATFHEFIVTAFAWAETQEGVKYWQMVCREEFKDAEEYLGGDPAGRELYILKTIKSMFK